MNEIKNKFLQEGYIIAEKANGENPTEIEIVVVAIDIDNMRFEYKMHLPTYEYESDDFYISKVENAVGVLRDLISKRRVQNISICEHKITMIGSVKACAYCLGKFGDVINLNLMRN